MKDIKRRLEHFSFYDHSGIAAHLEQMAEKGWMLIQMNALFWIYRRIEPRKLRFAVTYFPKASDFDPAPSEKQQSFQDFCETAGWKSVATLAQMQVFCSGDLDAVPIETDAEVQVANIHAAMVRNFLPSYLLLMLLSVLQCGLIFWRLRTDPIGVLVSSNNLFTVFSWLLVFILGAIEIISYFRWRGKAKAAAERDGSFVQTKSHRSVMRIGLAAVFIMLLVWILGLSTERMKFIGILSIINMSVLFALVNLVKYVLKRKRVSTAVNRAVTLAASFVLSFALMGSLIFCTFAMLRNEDSVSAEETYEHNGRTWEVYHDNLPLTIEDMTGEKQLGYSYKSTAEKSLLAEQLEGNQDARLDAANDLPTLRYSVTKLRINGLYKLCRDGVLRRYEERGKDVPGEFREQYIACDAAPWGAKEAYQYHAGKEAYNRYLVCWENRLAEINFSWEPTPEQMRIAAERLQQA